MADLPVQPVQNYGNLLSSYGEGLANQENASTNNLNARAALAQVPSEIAARQAGIGQTQATTGLIGSQAQGKDIENQKAALMLQLTKNALHNFAESSDAAAAPTAGAGTGNAGGDTEEAQPTKSNADSRFRPDDESAAHFDQVVSNKFRVNPAFTPQEQAQFSASIPLAIGGDHGMLDAVKAQHDQRVQTQVANSQNQAQQAFDKMYAVNTAPAGTAFTALKGAYSQAADHLAKIHGLDPDHPEKWTPAEQKELDDSARKYAGMLHNTTFQYTGDKLEDKNGITVNSRTGQRPIGDQAQGISPTKYADLIADARTLTNIPDPKGGPDIRIAKWRSAGFPNEAAYVRSVAKGGVGTGAAGATTLGGKDQPVAGAGAGTTAVVSPAQAGTAPPTTGNLTQDPILRKMLADPEFKSPPVVPSNAANGFRGMSKEDDARNTARTNLLDSSEDLTSASSQGLQYALAAKKILDSKGAPVTGLYAPILREISRMFPGGVNAANYQEISKYLGNLSVQNFKQNFGSKPANAEFQIQMNVLNPNEKMQPAAVRALLDTNIRNMQYGIDSSSRVNKFLASGGDPQKFHKADQKYFPREDIVNGPSGAATEKTAVTSTSTAPPVTVKSRAEAMALPAGTHFKTPDGRTLIAPGKPKNQIPLGETVPALPGS